MKVVLEQCCKSSTILVQRVALASNLLGISRCVDARGGGGTRTTYFNNGIHHGNQVNPLAFIQSRQHLYLEIVC